MLPLINRRRAIEVKKESRGIADDIIKCQKLLRLPEVIEAYIAAPELIISPDHIAFAKSVGVGVISITSSQLTWVVESWRRRGASLTGYESQPSHVAPGELKEIVKESGKAPPGMPGRARSTMALTVIVILGVAVFHLLVKGGPGDNSQIIGNVLSMLGGLLAAITGFYFGGKAAEKYGRRLEHIPSLCAAYRLHTNLNTTVAEGAGMGSC